MINGVSSWLSEFLKCKERGSEVFFFFSFVLWVEREVFDEILMARRFVKMLFFADVN